MTHGEFLQWLDEEINYLKNMEDAQQLARDGHTKLFVLQQVKEKFLTLTPPPTTLS